MRAAWKSVMVSVPARNIVSSQRRLLAASPSLTLSGTLAESHTKRVSGLERELAQRISEGRPILICHAARWPYKKQQERCPKDARSGEH